MVVCSVLLRMDVARNRAWLGVVAYPRVASQAGAVLADHGLSALYRADYDAATISGIPSIMCGFAVILAFVLTLKVAPEAVIKREDRRGLSFLRGVVGE